MIPPAGGGAKVRAAAFGDRVRGLLEVARAGSGARRRIAALRSERERLLDERRSRLAALGEAVYGGHEAATSSERAGLERLDAAIAEREAEMERIMVETQEHVARTRLTSEPTQIVNVEEPMPPPGEADPPDPVRIPEPYPPPGEADPPEPVRIPEPYPDPGEADPPEPARIPEPGPPSGSS